MQWSRAAVAATAGMAVVAVTSVAVLAASTEVPPAGQAGVVCAPPGANPGQAVAGFADSQLANAAAIVATGVEMGAPVRAQLIAVATAMQESSLFMYANSTVAPSLAVAHERVGSDHDSVGLFQQRAGWGSVAERMDPKASARLFYEQLLARPGWESMSLARAAQSVQISAFPDAYARWERAANQVVGSIAGVVCTGGGGVDLPPNPQARTVITRALSQLDVPYVWGGGNERGPTGGGFDCSGLMVYAFAGISVSVPHQTQAIWATFQPAITDRGQIAPGDMLLFSSNGRPGGIHHVGLYLGEGRMLHAPETGSTVQIAEDVWASAYWSREFIGAVRPLPAGNPSA